MQGTTFAVTIPNLPKLQAALASYPSIAAPIVQKAIAACQAILGTNTNASTVPIRTGQLSQQWAFELGNLQGRYYPRTVYAPYVELGTAPHIIQSKGNWPLRNAKTGEVFGRTVHHPGTRANPFMERIVAASQPAIEALFGHAMDNITAAIASQANG